MERRRRRGAGLPAALKAPFPSACPLVAGIVPELERPGYYGLALRGPRLAHKALSRRRRRRLALMDAAADEGKEAVTPCKRTLPSPSHLHLKGQFTQISRRLAAAPQTARGESRQSGGFSLKCFDWTSARRKRKRRKRRKLQRRYSAAARRPGCATC